MIIIAWIGSIIALLFVAYLAFSLRKADSGNDVMKKISLAVQKGAKAYLKQQYKVVAIVFIVLFVVLAYIAFVLKLLSPFVPFAFITGGFFSGLAGFIGMSVATKANAKTAAAAQKSLNAGLRVAFSAGSVMGMTVVGLGLLDLAIWYSIKLWCKTYSRANPANYDYIWNGCFYNGFICKSWWRYFYESSRCWC